MPDCADRKRSVAVFVGVTARPVEQYTLITAAVTQRAGAGCDVLMTHTQRPLLLLLLLLISTTSTVNCDCLPCLPG